VDEAGIGFRDIFGRDHMVAWEEIHTIKNRRGFWRDMLLLDRDGKVLVGIDYFLTDFPAFLRALFAKLSIQRPVRGKQEVEEEDLDWDILKPGGFEAEVVRPKRRSPWSARAEPIACSQGEPVTPSPSDGIDPHYLESVVLRTAGELRITIRPDCVFFYGRRGNLIGGLAFVLFVPMTLLLMLFMITLAGTHGHKDVPPLYFAGFMAILFTSMSTVMYLLHRRFRRPTHLTANSRQVVVDRPGWIFRRRHEFQSPGVNLEVRKGLPLLTGGWKLRVRDGEVSVDVAQDMRKVEIEWLVREVEKMLQVPGDETAAPSSSGPEGVQVH
jgi:hypothetical protein